MGAPPEPTAFWFVKRSEEERNSGVCNAFELDGDGVDVAEKERVVRAIRS